MNQVQVVPFVMACVAVLVGSIFGLVILLTVLRNGQRRREWEHAERMRSLEMGLPLAPRNAPWAKATVGLAIGAGVPLYAFLFTGLSTTNGPETLSSEIWLAPTLVSLVSVVGACILTGYLFGQGSRSDQVPAAGETSVFHNAHGMKPAHDPDAFDVAGSRG